MAPGTHRTLSFSVQTTCIVVLMMAMPRACGDDQQVARVGREPAPSSAIVLFDRDEAATDALESLDAIVGRAWSDWGARVLIVGYANERSSLLDNLDLAERRARFVANHLLARGVSRSLVVVASMEATPEDPAGARCEVEIVRPSLHAIATNLN